MCFSDLVFLVVDVVGVVVAGDVTDGTEARMEEDFPPALNFARISSVFELKRGPVGCAAAAPNLGAEVCRTTVPVVVVGVGVAPLSVVVEV